VPADAWSLRLLGAGGGPRVYYSSENGHHV